MQMLEVQGTKSIEQTSWKLVESEHTGPDSQCLPGFICPQHAPTPTTPLLAYGMRVQQNDEARLRCIADRSRQGVLAPR